MLFVLSFCLNDITFDQPNMFHCTVCWRVQRDLGNSLFYLPPPPVLPPPELGPFGDYLCDSTPSLVESTLKFMKAKMGDQADFIVWTG